MRESAEALQTGWASSQQAMPAGEAFFLAPEFVAEACAATCLSAEVTGKAVALGARIAGDAALRALAWHCHYCLFRAEDYPRDRVREWPTLEEALGEDHGMFNVLVLLSGVPQMRAIHKAHRVPADIVRDTMSQIEDRLEEHRAEQGAWGMTPRYVGWFMNHLTGILYRLVRLQFQFGSFGYRLRAFRHRDSGAVVALSEQGVRYRADGQTWRAHDGPAGAWSAELSLGDHEVRGNPIAPTGRALRESVRLPAEEWRQVLGPGDPILNIHIPGGGPMDYEQCGQSFELALKFFPRHFPERPFVGFCCGSWILNTLIQELLPDSSNLVRFQREVYLFPIGLDNDSLARSIFGEVPEDLSRAPKDTSFRRAWLQRMSAGKDMRAGAGACFLLPEDLSWGGQVYLSQELPWQA